jgi:divalent metal cation (Fe/Co/Zn/Cd) transporter
VHVATDVVVSVLVIVGLFAARALNWLWLDPAVGLLGAAVVGIWAFNLLRSAGAVLLDMSPDPTLPQKIVSLVSAQPQGPSVYKSRLADLRSLSHVTIEVETWKR